MAIEEKALLDRARTSQGFMIALAVAGKDGCECDACKILTKIKKEMAGEFLGRGESKKA